MEKIGEDLLRGGAVGRGGALLRPLGSCKFVQYPVGADAHLRR